MRRRRARNSLGISFGKAILALSVVGFLLLPLPAFSQANSGQIVGAISDQSGAVIAGAAVSIIDVDRGAARTLMTDSAGEYVAPNLIPGTYTVHAEAKGFNTVERKDVLVEVGKDVRVDLTLKPGSETQVVTVTGETPMIDTQSATLGGTVETQALNELPINGRNYQELLAYKPGVEAKPGGGTGAYLTNGAFGIQRMDSRRSIQRPNEQRMEHRGRPRSSWRIDDHSASRRHSGSQCRAKSQGGSGLETRRPNQRRTKVGHQQSSWHGLCIWARRFFRCTKSVFPDARRISDGTIRRQRGRPHQER